MEPNTRDVEHHGLAPLGSTGLLSDMVLRAVNVEAKGKRRRRIMSLLGLLAGGLAALATTFSVRDFEKNHVRHTLLDSLKVVVDTEQVRLRRQTFKATALSCYFRRQYDSAIAWYDSALSVDPNSSELHNLRGYSLLRSGRKDDAVKELQFSVELDPSYLWGHFNLGVAYLAVGRREDATEQVREVLRLRPDYEEALVSDGQFARLFRSVRELRALMKSNSPSG
jgi:tetratricopeptide (TPR) repeat protein